MKCVPALLCTTWFDIFRTEDGKRAKHWDYSTLNAVPSE